jgi:hypothetical protein
MWSSSNAIAALHRALWLPADLLHKPPLWQRCQQVVGIFNRPDMQANAAKK